MKKIQWVLAGLALVLLGGCTTSGTYRYTPRFDYNPPREAKPAAAGISFAVVNATYPELIQLYQTFSQNISQDFFEILTARGYTIRGPFRTYDDVTFPDKKGSDLTLMPNLQLYGDASGLKWNQNLGVALLGMNGYTAEGNLVINGRVNLVVAESLSREKMWTKSVEIPPIVVRVDKTRIYTTPITSVEALLESENGIYSGVAKALEEQYKTILDKAYVYLDPDEMMIVKKQAQEIRKSKVY